LGLGDALGLDLVMLREVFSETRNTQYELMMSLGLGGLDKSGVSELTFLSWHGRRL